MSSASSTFSGKRGHLLEQRFSQPPFQFVHKPSTSVYMLIDSSYMTSAVPECNSRLPLRRLYFIGHTLSFPLPSFSQCFYLEKCSYKIILKHHRTTEGRTEAYCYTAMVYLFPLQNLFLPLVS